MNANYGGNLADLVNARRKPESQIMISRLFFAVLLREGQATEGESELKKLVQEMNMNINAQITANQRMSSGVSEDKSITGFTLINGPVIISVLESVPEHIQEIILQLNELAKPVESLYEKIKILAVNEENPDRLFPSWEFGKLSDVGLTVNEVDKTEEEQTKRVCEVYRTFLDAAFDVIHGKKANELGILERGIATDITAKQKSEIISRVAPSQETTSILIYSKFPTVQEYCEIFFDEEELTLEDEITFPQPPYLSEFLQYKKEPFQTYNGFKG